MSPLSRGWREGQLRAGGRLDRVGANVQRPLKQLGSKLGCFKKNFLKKIMIILLLGHSTRGGSHKNLNMSKMAMRLKFM